MICNRLQRVDFDGCCLNLLLHFMPVKFLVNHALQDLLDFHGR